jgi:hypothetical protein
MWESIGTKDGIVLYHIGYGIVLGCPTISGVTSCRQLKCYLTDIGLVTKLGYIWVCCTSTPTWSLVCSVPQVVKKFGVFLSLISSIYHPQKENSWTHVQPIDNMHKLM